LSQALTKPPLSQRWFNALQSLGMIGSYFKQWMSTSTSLSQEKVCLLKGMHETTDWSLSLGKQLENSWKILAKQIS